MDRVHFRANYAHRGGAHYDYHGHTDDYRPTDSVILLAASDVPCARFHWVNFSKKFYAKCSEPFSYVLGPSDYLPVCEIMQAV